MKLSNLIDHPAAYATALFMGFSQVFHLGFAEALLSVVYGNVSMLFTAFSIAGWTVVPNVGLPPIVGDSIQTLAILFALVYLFKLVTDFVEKVQEKV